MAAGILIALLLVLVTFGSFTQLANLKFELVTFLVLALVIQIGIEFVPFPKARIGDVGLGLLLASYALLLAFTFVNFKIRGMVIITIGIAMNTLVIGLNEGMPFKVPTELRNGVVVKEHFDPAVKHRPQKPGDLALWLSDIIFIPKPVNEILSFGDLVIIVGIIDVCFWGSRRRRRGGHLPDEPDPDFDQFPDDDGPGGPADEHIVNPPPPAGDATMPIERTPVVGPVAAALHDVDSPSPPPTAPAGPSTHVPTATPPPPPRETPGDLPRPPAEPTWVAPTQDRGTVALRASAPGGLRLVLQRPDVDLVAMECSTSVITTQAGATIDLTPYDFEDDAVDALKRAIAAGTLGRGNRRSLADALEPTETDTSWPPGSSSFESPPFGAADDGQ